MREVRVVSDLELFVRGTWKYILGIILFVGGIWAWGAYPQIAVPVLAGLTLVWYGMKVNSYRRRLERVYAARNKHLRELGVEHWEAWDLCLQDINELASASLAEEDIRREVVLGDKHPRPVALAALEFAILPWPSLPWPLSFREQAFHQKIRKPFDDELEVIRRVIRRRGDLEGTE